MPEATKFIQVLPGTTQFNETLNDGDFMGVYGSAVDTIVSGGSLVIYEGGEATGATIGSGTDDWTAPGSCVVSAGGSAEIVTVNAGGGLIISGRVTSATVNQYGSAEVYEGGQAKDFTIDGGEMQLFDGAYVFPATGGSKLLVKNMGSLLLFEGARIEGVEVVSDGYVSIDKANMTSAFFSYGFATVRDGAVLSSSTVNDGSVITVTSGGVVENVTFNVGGKITGNMYDCRNLRFNAGIVDFNIVADYIDGGFYINELTTFLSPKTETYHCFYTVTADIDQECGTYKLIQDATGFLDDQKIWIENYYGGAVLDYITLEEGAKTIEGQLYKLNLSDTNELTLTISALTPPDVKDNLEETRDLDDGMYGSNVNILTDGTLNLNSGARAMDTTVYNGGTLNVNDGGRAIDTYVESGGSAEVSAGGRASGIFVNAGGRLRVREGGKATLVRENGGYVEDNGDVEFEPLAFTWSTINADATVHSGTTAINTTINPNGQLTVFNGGRAETTTVYGYGALVVRSGGVADGTLIAMPNAVVTVSSGGKLTGWVMLADNALVTAAVGATIDFDLVNTKAKPGAAQGLVNKLSVIQFSNNTDFTLTVNGKEEAGEYNLAGSAADFDSYITVQTASGRHLDTLSVGEGFSYRDRTYWLSLDSDKLLLTVNALPADIYGDLNYECHLATGELASAVNVIAGGDLYVDEGAVAVDTTVNPGGWLDVTKDGVAYDTTVDGGGVYVYEDGVIYDTTLNSGGRLTISAGASAVGLTVESGGDVTIYDGAEVYEIKENGGGVFVNAGADVTFVHNEILGLDLYDYDWASVHSGTTATYTTVNWDGRLVVYDGGLVSSSVVCADGALDVEGGEAKGVVVSSGGRVNLKSGGSVTGLDAEAGAALNFAIAPFTYAQGTYDGGDIDIAPETIGLTVASGMTIEVFEGGLASETIVESGGNCLVMSDGEVEEALVHSGAYFYVASGGSATGLIVDSGARFYMTVAPFTYAQGTYDGNAFKATNTLSDFTVLSNGGIYADEGARLQNVTVDYGAEVYISSGATATKIVENGGNVSIEDGAKVTFTPNEFVGIDTEDMVYRIITVHSGTTATDTTLNGEGQMEVYDGGYANGTVVNAFGELSVCGGSAYNTRINTDASMTVSSGGSAKETTIDGFGDMAVLEGGKADGIDILTGGCLYVGDDGKAEDIGIQVGSMYVDEGGTAGSILIQAGEIFISSGGSVDDITVGADADLYVSAGGKATKIKENGGFVDVQAGASVTFVANTFTGVTLDGDSATVHSRTTATDTIVDNFANLLVLGGRAIDTDVRAYGSLTIGYGGTANGITAQKDAIITVNNGGKVTGAMTIDGAVFSVEAGATFDFDISPCSPDNAAVVDNLSVVMSQPFDFTITVDGMQEKGSYTLAESAAGFNETVEVYNTTGMYLGTLSVLGGAKTLADGRDYTLTLSGSDLCLTIGILPDDTTPPTVENIQADITTPTNKDVTVTADFLDYGGISERRYKLAGDTDWSMYPDYGVVVTENTTVSFQAVDSNGLKSTEESIIIDYIDKEAPTIVVTPSTTGLTESLTLKAEFDDNDYVVGAYYKIADDVWTPYSDEGVTVTENTAVSFQAYDEAGNETTVVHEVKNIGKADITGDLNTTANLTDGMIGYDVHILDGGELNVSSGGRALETDVNDGGELSIYNGGIADVVTVNPGGAFYVNSGGAAYQVRENGGDVWGYLGMVVEIVPNEFTGVTIAKGDYATVHSGTTATDTTVQSGGVLEVYSGGTATGIAAEEGAILDLTVAPGTYEQGTYDGAGFEIGDTANGLSVHSRCRVYVSKGGIVRETTVSSDGWLYVSSGGVASDTTIEKGGDLAIREGGTASGVSVRSGGWIFNNAGGSATGIVAEEGAILFLDIAPDTYAQGTYNGSAFAYDSAVAGITVDSHFYIIPTIQDGGTADDITIGSGGCLYVSSGGSADDISVEKGGTLFMYGGKATQVRENGGYVMDYYDAVTYVSNTFTGFTITDSATVHSGTTAAHTTVEGEKGELAISGGVAIDTTVNDGGAVTIYSSGTADNTTVNNGGTFNMYGHGGIATDTTVNDGGNLYATGGTVNGLVVNAGGSFELHGKLTGKVVFDENAVVNVGGATVDFDLTQTAPGEDALVNDLSFVMHPSTSYTLTVDGTEANGKYSLAEGAAGFTTETITVKNTGGDSLGTLMADGSMKTLSDGRDYTLTLNGAGNLSITIGAPDTTKPVVTNIQPSTIEFTNQDVTVTAEFNDDVGVVSKLYKLQGDTDWTAYPDGGVVVDKNTTVYFKAIDTSGNESDEASYDVVVIDKVPPTITINPSTTEPGAESVTLNAVCNDETSMSSILQYRIGDGAWQDCTADVVVTENTTVSFRTYDTAGNETVESYAVTNIETSTPDTTKPVVTNIQPSTIEFTNQDVTVTAEFTDDVKVASKLYKLQGDTDWTAYPDGGVVVDKNTTVYFKAIDTSGNESDETSYDVVVIDKVPPAITINPSTTEPGAESVTLNAVCNDETSMSSILQYRIGDGAWQDCTADVVVTENTTVSFRTYDTAGNETVESYAVTNISTTEPDTTCPTITDVKADITGLTNQNVTVTAVFDDDVALKSKLYKLQGDTDWTAYPDGGVVVDKNTTVYFKAVDTSGNEANNSITISNIDKVAPTITGITPSTTAPAASVTVTATFADNVSLASRQYRIGSGAWTVYTDSGVTVTENVTVTFKAVDTAGNNKEASYTVTNIEEAATSNEPANNWVYRKKAWNDPEKIALFYVNNVVALAANETQLIYLDTKGTVDSGNGKYNSVSRTKVGEETVEDASDYAKIELAYGAALKFSVDSEVGGTFYVYEKTKDKKGNDIAKQCQKITVKADKTSPAKLTTIYLNAGEYYVGMEAKLPSARKYPEYNAYYNVQLTGTKYFDNADGGWNASAYKLDADEKEDKFHLNPTLKSKALVLERGVTDIKLDDGAAGTDDWVGFTDVTDYRMIKLDNPVNLTLSLKVTGTETGYGKAKLTIWKVTTNSKTGKITLSSKGAVVVKQGATGLLKSKFLGKGEYFISVTSMDAKKGGDVSYNVKVDGKNTLFFDSIDDGKNNELYNKKAKAFYGETIEDTEHVFENTTVSKGSSINIKLDTEAAKADGYDNFVGYKDKTDYAKITVSDSGKLSLTVKATGNCTFTVYKKGEKNGKDTLDVLQTTKLTLAKDASVAGGLVVLEDVAPTVEYYVSMTAANTSSTAKGSVYYRVTATLESSETSSLAMPETSDSLAIADALSFGSYDTDALADVSDIEALSGQSDWLKLGSIA